MIRARETTCRSERNRNACDLLPNAETRRNFEWGKGAIVSGGCALGLRMWEVPMLSGNWPLTFRRLTVGRSKGIFTISISNASANDDIVEVL
ncbi:hypothetical protein Trydic_g23480 [Trypoxylus dichotomus]